MTKVLTNPLDLAALAVGAVLLLALAVRVAKAGRRAGGARVAQVVALSVTMPYSGLTSWQWATARLSAPVWERCIVFAAFEVVMIAFALASRANRLKVGRSGWQHGATMFFATLMSLMALQVAGSPLVAAVRFAGGPLASLLLFHSLLGLELRHQGAQSESLIGSALREVRERLTARLGIGRRGADSAAIARSRAADRAVAYASRRKLSQRAAERLAAAIDAAQHGLEADAAAVAEASIVARIMRRKSVGDLHGLEARHVWSPVPAVSGTPASQGQNVPEAYRGTYSAARTPAVPAAGRSAITLPQARRTRRHAADVPAAPADVPEYATESALRARALEINAESLAEYGRPAGIRPLREGLGVGAARATEVRDWLAAHGEQQGAEVAHVNGYGTV